MYLIYCYQSDILFLPVWDRSLCSYCIRVLGAFQNKRIFFPIASEVLIVTSLDTCKSLVPGAPRHTLAARKSSAYLKFNFSLIKLLGLFILIGQAQKKLSLCFSERITESWLIESL